MPKFIKRKTVLITSAVVVVAISILTALLWWNFLAGRFKKTASIKKTAAMIAEEIIAVTEIYQQSPGGKVFKKTIKEKYVNDGTEISNLR